MSRRHGWLKIVTRRLLHAELTANAQVSPDRTDFTDPKDSLADASGHSIYTASSHAIGYHNLYLDGPLAPPQLLYSRDA